MIERVGQKLKDIFQESDIYGQSVIIHLGKKKKHKTCIGSCFTLMTGMIVALALYYLLKQLVEQQNPTIIEIEDILSDNDEYFNSLQNFKFGLSFYSADSKIINQTEAIKSIQSSLQFSLVSEDRFGNFINLNSNYDSLSPLQEDPSFKYIFPDLSQDQVRRSFKSLNSKSTNQWKLQVTINQSIEGTGAVFWQLTYFDSYDNLQLNGDPAISFQQDQYFQLLQNKNEIFLQFRKKKVQTDVGWLTEEMQYAELISQELYDQNPLSDSSTMVQEVQFSLNRKIYIVKRSYIKIQSILTQIGGLLKVVVLFFHIVSFPLIKLSLQLELVNSVFQFEDQTTTDPEQEALNQQQDQQQNPKENKEILENGTEGKQIKHHLSMVPMSAFARSKFKIPTVSIANSFLLSPDQSAQIKSVQVKEQTHQKAQGDESPNGKLSISEPSNGDQNNSQTSNKSKDRKESIFKVEQQQQSTFNFLSATQKEIRKSSFQQLQLNSHYNQKATDAKESVLPTPDSMVLSIPKEGTARKDLTGGPNESPSNQTNQQHYEFSQSTLLNGRSRLYSLQRRESTNLNVNTFKLNTHSPANKVTQEDKKKLIKKLAQQKFAKISKNSPSSPDSPLQSVELQQARHIVNGKKNEDFNSIFTKLFKTITHNYLVMKFLDKLKYLLKIKFPKQQQLKFSMDKIRERLDIIFIMKKIVEIDKLKMVLFDQNQLKIFEYLPRPVIKFDPYTIEEKEKRENYFKKINPIHPLKQSLQKDDSSDNILEIWQHALIESDKPYFQKVQEAAVAYERLNKKENKDKFDIKLLQFLDNQRKYYFEEILKPSSPASPVPLLPNLDQMSINQKANPNQLQLDRISENNNSNAFITQQNINIQANQNKQIDDQVNNVQGQIIQNLQSLKVLQNISESQNLGNNLHFHSHTKGNNLTQKQIQQSLNMFSENQSISICSSNDLGDGGQDNIVQNIHKNNYMQSINKFQNPNLTTAS